MLLNFDVFLIAVRVFTSNPITEPNHSFLNRLNTYINHYCNLIYFNEIIVIAARRLKLS